MPRSIWVCGRVEKSPADSELAVSVFMRAA
jgi:hypothetical protein